MHYLKRLARKAAEDVVNSARPDNRAMYSGDTLGDAIYSVSGLADDIIDTYYNEYEDETPSYDLFYDIADQIAF